MQSSATATSVAALGGRVGPASERHLMAVFRAALSGPEFSDAGRYLRLVTGEAHPFGNLVVIDDPADFEGAREAIASLDGVAAPSAVLFVGQSVASAIEPLLAAAGFQAHGEMPAMAVDIGSLASTTLPEGCAFERSRPAEAQEWTKALSAGYEIPFGVAKYFSPLAIQDSGSADAPFQFFSVKRNGRVVGTTLIALRDGLAGVYCVATLPEERGKGIGAHVTAESLRVVAAAGYRVGVLQSSPMGHPVYRRLGFTAFGGIPMFVRMPG